MRRFLCLCAIALMLVLPREVLAQVVQRVLRVPVGQSVAFVPDALPVRVTCDDLSIVSVEDATSYLWVTGLREGSTLCNFASIRTPGQSQLYLVVVTPQE
jgi:hypothetical protein